MLPHFYYTNRIGRLIFFILGTLHMHTHRIQGNLWALSTKKAGLFCPHSALDCCGKAILCVLCLCSLDADVWKKFLSRPALPFILRLLRGLATQHPPTQVMLKDSPTETTSNFVYTLSYSFSSTVGTVGTKFFFSPSNSNLLTVKTRSMLLLSHIMSSAAY